MSPDATTDVPQLTETERLQLLRVAAASIDHGLRHGEALAIGPTASTPALDRPRACFVTLYRGDELRGCVGTLEERRPLLQQVADSAYDAAFRDTRLPSVEAAELGELTVEISVLSALSEIPAATERDLFGTLRPGVDGVVLTEGDLQATFLPKVWDTFQLAFDFVEHLKRKAGLPPRYWSRTLRWQRYTVESFEARIGELMDE